MTEGEHDSDRSGILVVECDDGVRFVLTEILKAWGYEVYEACDGLQALELAEQHRFDCVVTEVSLPSKSGGDTIRALRQLDPECKIIAMSGYGPLAGNPQLGAALEAGAQDTLDKPISCARLRAAVNRLIAGKSNGPAPAYPSASPIASRHPGGGSRIPSSPSAG
jgi:two-component system response regulator (stage 0 sporulation protein F)